MRASYYLTSMLHAFVVLSLFALSAGILLLPYAPHLRVLCYEALQESSKSLFYIGWSVGGYATLLLLAFWLSYRKKSITFKMEGATIHLERDLIQSYVEEYWQQLTQEPKARVEVIIRNRENIEIIVGKMPPETGDEHDLDRIEADLGRLLARKLGYHEDFYLTLRA